MKSITRSLSLLLVLCLLFLTVPLVACDLTGPGNGGTTPTDGDDTSTDGDDPPAADIPTDGKLKLFDGNTAQFHVVVTAASGTSVARAANRFVRRLRELGAQIADPQNDFDPAAVSDCEILIGANAQNRDAAYVANISGLSPSSYVIRVVGNRVLIYGGSDEATVEALDYFTAACLYVNDDSTSIGRDSIKRSYEKKYERIQTMKVGGIPLAEYAFVVSEATIPINFRQYAEQLRDAFYQYTGAYPEIRTESEAAPAHPIYIRVADGGETGFRVRLSGGALLVECSYDTTLSRSIDRFIEHTVANFAGNVDITERDVFTEDATRIYYSEYGAVGDGKTDDYAALLRTHETANITGQTVCADAGKTYYIGEILKTIPIRTDVEWGTATFIIDDRNVRCTACDPIPGLSVNPRSVHIFSVASDYQIQTIADRYYSGLSLAKGASKINMTFEGNCLLYPQYNGKKIFIRSGGNQNDGTDTQELLLVDREGNIDPSTAVLWEYPAITRMRAKRIDDKPITITGGIFYTYANTHPRLYHYFNRGIDISRSNTIIKDIQHYVRFEGDTGAPYGSFLGIADCNNVLINNCVLSGHKLYALDGVDYYNPMGTYDITSTWSNNVTIDNCRQCNSITDGALWGVHASNFCKNLTLKNSTFSRFDAHQGMYNATILNSTLGQTLNCIGAGLLYIDGLNRTGGNNFIYLRGDYGATWEGDVIVKNSSLEEKNPQYGLFYFVNMSWDSWDYGHTCYMPQNITVENFSWTEGTVLIFLHLPQKPDQSIKPYHVTKTLTLNQLQGKQYQISDQPDTFRDLVVTVNGNPI